MTKRIYLLNTLVTPINFDKTTQAKITLKRVNLKEAKSLLAKGFTSAVGHKSTANLLSKLLGVNVPANRDSVFMEKGDKAIHFFPKQRLPEGAILDEKQLTKLDYWLILSEVEETSE